MNNIYLPLAATVQKIISENEQIKTFIVAFQDNAYNEKFTYEPGQFMMVSMPHYGEAPISISSTPSRPGTIHLSVRKAGGLTEAMHKLKEGDYLGLRGPYGRPFPMDIIGNNILFVAGGIGLAPLRSVIDFSLDRGTDTDKKSVLYGSRTPSDIAFKDDIQGWQKHPGVSCRLTVDQAEDGWSGSIGVVTTLLEDIDFDPESGCAMLCGPPIMIKFTLAKLLEIGFPPEKIWTTMERYMKCGVGLCGHCHLDDKLVCVDGPVFNLHELNKLDVEI